MYIHTYRYVGVQKLFAGFGHDIRIDGVLFAEFLTGTRDERLKGLLHKAVGKAG